MMPLPFTSRRLLGLNLVFNGMFVTLIFLIWQPASIPRAGQQIVYSSSIGQTANSYILNTDASAYDRLSLDGHPLTLSSCSADGESSCSADGEQLAFVADGQIHLLYVPDGRLWSASLDEIPFRPVTLMALNTGGVLAASRPGEAASRPGETIYFQPAEDGLLERGGNPLSPGSAITLSSVERFRAYALARTTLPDTRLPQMPLEAHTWDSTWSPDGALLAYPTLIHGSAAIHLWDARTRLSVQLTFMPGAEYRPTWSSDGQQLAFLTDQISYADFYIMEISSDPPQHLFSTREIICSRPVRSILTCASSTADRPGCWRTVPRDPAVAAPEPAGVDRAGAHAGGDPECEPAANTPADQLQ